MTNTHKNAIHKKGLIQMMESIVYSSFIMY